MSPEKKQSKNACLGNARQQSGAALIVALVVLAAVTLVGVSNMQSSSFEMKMTASTVDRSNAFAIAETALRQVEARLEAGEFFGLTVGDLQSDACAAGRCFNDTCTDGLCFEGVYDSTMVGRIACEVAPNAGASDRSVFWRGNVWDVDTAHRVEAVGTSDVKFIIEFLCFIDSGDGAGFNPSPGNENNGYPLFRITVLYEGERGRAPVMLQSTYSLEI